MRQLDLLLARLRTLTPTDRRWILENASQGMRERLLTALGATAASLQKESIVAQGRRCDSDVIAGASPQAVVDALKGEPSWVVATIFQIEQWPWAAAVREALPAMRRPRAGEAAAGNTPSTAFAEILVKRLAERLKLAPASNVLPYKVNSRFEELLERLRSNRVSARIRS